MRLKQRIQKALQALFSNEAEETGIKGGSEYSPFTIPWVRYYNRKNLYDDLYDMDKEDSIVARALDIITRFAVFFPEDDIDGFILEAPKEEEEVIAPVATILQENAFEFVRSMLLAGSTFIEIIVGEDASIKRLKLFPFPYQILVNTDEYGNLLQGDPELAMQAQKSGIAAYDQIDDTGSLIAAFWPYQILHLAFGNKNGGVYAEPILGCVSGTWKRLRAKEDGLAIARLTRSFPQRVHKIPVPIEANADQVQKKIDQYRDNMNVDTMMSYDESNTRFRAVQRNAPTNVDTDYYKAKLYTPDGRAVVEGEIENVDASNPYLENIDDIYLDLRRIICALQVPMTYLNMRVGQRAFIDRSAEGEQEAFAYLIRHVQRAYATGVRQVLNIQLLLHGINPFTAKYELVFPRVSPNATMRSAQVDNTRAQTAALFLKMGIPPEVVGQKVLRLSNSDLQKWVKSTGGEIPQEALQHWSDEVKRQFGIQE